MSDATQHDAHTAARKAGAMKLICLSREIGQLDQSKHGMRLRLCSVSEEGWLTLCGEVVGTVTLPLVVGLPTYLPT